MNLRTDLAVEAIELDKKVPLGITKKEYEKAGITVSIVEVNDEESAKKIGKPIGRYTTIQIKNFKFASNKIKEEVEIIADRIRELIPKEGAVLLAGLGNSDITPDAIGPLTISQILATRHIPEETIKSTGLPELRVVAAIATGVLGQTGVESSEIIGSICKQIDPCVVIAVDALAAGSTERLGCTVQISDTGITPGSGVKNSRKELSQKTLGIPVIAIGVPTVADLSAVTEAGFADNMMITPREIDVIVERASKTVAYAINKALQPTLTFEDITALIS